MSLTRQMSLLLAAALLLATGGSLVAHMQGMHRALTQQIALRNAHAATVLALSLSRQHGEQAAMQALVAAQFEIGDDRRIAVTTPDGRVWLERRSERRQAQVPGWFAHALPLDAAPGRARVMDGPREVGSVEVLSHTDWAEHALWIALWRSAAMLAALGAVCGMLAGWLLRRWQRSWHDTMAQARALEEGRFVFSDEPHAPELRQVTRAMNSMVTRLSQMFATQALQVAELQRRAHLDPVTGLANRRHLLGQLGSALAETGAPGCCLLIVRTLNLAELNHRFGHDAVDHMLAALAEVLENYPKRIRGAFTGRLNGGDFALCLPVPGVAGETAESLRDAMQAIAVGTMADLGVVIGAADGLRGVSAGVALAATDAALAEAESGGAGTVAIHAPDDVVADPAGSRAWRAQITQALAEHRVQLDAFPVLDPNGKLLHLECPLRVQLQAQGPYHAARRWLALASRSRLLPRVDLTAIELALRACAIDERPRCVHVSAASLAAPDFHGELDAALAAAVKGAPLLWIDIDARSLDRAAAGVPRLAALAHRHGVRVGIEHAGHALPGPGALGGLALSHVKVDARWVRGAAVDAAVRDLAQGLAALVHGLGAIIIAEGIDDAGDLSALFSLGFDGATGPALRAPAEPPPPAQAVG